MGKGGELSCGESCMKYLLFFFNFLFFIIGAALLGIGIWLRVDDDMSHVVTLSSSTGDGYAAVYFIIALGAFVFLLGFLGCGGACCESKCMLGAYAGIIILIIILEIVAAILAGVYRSQIESGMLEEMQKQVQNQYGQAGQDGITESWDYIQQQFECCGASGKQDWTSSDWANDQTLAGTVPSSCCTDTPSTCQATDAHDTGCRDAVFDWIKQNIGIIIGVCCAVIVFEIVSAVMACCVMKGI